MERKAMRLALVAGALSLAVIGSAATAAPGGAATTGVAEPTYPPAPITTNTPPGTENDFDVTYNVCRGTGVSIGVIADRLIARAGGRLDIVVDAALLRTVEVPRLVGDPTKLIEATGWSPRHTLDETLDAVLADARAQVQGS